MSFVQSYLLKQIAEKKISKTDGETMLKELNGGKNEKTGESIAIIGMAGKFADCNNIDEFWSAIEEGKNCIRDFPTQRMPDVDHFIRNQSYLEFIQGDFFTEIEDVEKIYRKGGYLSEIDKFDAAFFGISPREAKYMEPIQRFFLETAYESIEEAGYGGDKICGTKTGVFVGRDNTSIPFYRYITEPDTMHLTGSYGGILASRLSYIFNLQGPALVIDTACSSALISIHEACQSIRAGECDMAIAGGISVFSLGTLKDLKNPMGFDSIESPDDTIRTFDKDAEGTVWGEGVGVILLKPLSRALEDGDHIHAVIKGSAVNNDGASNGITAPSAVAQEDVILTAWRNAGIDPATIGYVEAHGTGTVLGDPIEIKGLTNAFHKYTDRTQFCGVGSLKPNMGHLVAASGVASLIKVVMSLKNKTLPPSIHFENPNQYINFIKSPVYVNDTLKYWEKEDHPRRAGISSFGFSGTNCHIIVEEADEIKEDAGRESGRTYCLTISAKSETALLTMIDEYKRSKQTLQSQHIEDICCTSNTGRGHYTYRLAILVSSVRELLEKLDSLDTLKTDEIQGIFYGQHKIVLESKKSRNTGDITDAEKAKLTKSVQALLPEISNAENDKNTALLKEIGSLYAAGAKVEWSQIYNGRKMRKAVIPVYPLERVRCWAEPKKSKLACKEREDSQIHPLIHNLVTDSIQDRIYETYFTTDNWVLSDHKILEHSVIAGTTYLEMAREAASRFYDTNELELKDITFLTPLRVGESEKRYVQVILKKEKEHIDFIIASRQKEQEKEIESQWIKHAQGKVFRLEEDRPSGLDIEEVIGRCGQKKFKVDMENMEGMFQFGPRWHSLKEVNYGSGIYTAKVELGEELRTDLDEYYLHPALLDNAINAVIKDNDGAYLPLNYKSFKLFGSTPAVFYSFIRKKDNVSGSKETITYDVTLADGQGKVFAEIVDYTIKRFDMEKLKIDELQTKNNCYYDITWIKKPDFESGPLLDGTVLILKDMTGTADNIMKKLHECGRQYIEVELGDNFQKIDDSTYMIGNTQEDYNKLIADIAGRNVKWILHMFSIHQNTQLETLLDLEEAQNRGVYSLYYLTRAVISQKLNKELNIMVISSYASEVVREQKIVSPQNAALMGLGKVIGQEYERLKVRYIDIDAKTGNEDIFNELTCREAPYAVAFRNQKRYVEQLKNLQLTKSNDKVDISDGKTFVITGGTGGLGLETARYLASGGKVNIALINRSAFPERSNWESILADNSSEKLCSKIEALKEMERKGASISCYSADVCKQEEIQKVLSDIRMKYGRINGIIHCAGVAGDGFIMLKDETVFKHVMAPKVMGTWLLDRLTREDKPEFMVLFSSVSAITGAPGQSDYTAANSFLDSYAAYRNTDGLKTVSINWPAWKETGMAVDHNAPDNIMMYRSISTVNAISYMEEILDSDHGRVIVGDINYDVLAVIKDRNLFGISEQIDIALKKQSADKITKNQNPVKKAAKEQSFTLQGKGEEEYTDTETLLGQIWGEVLGVSAIDIYENFYDLGGDSILATNLLKAIDGVFPGAVDISDVFAYPTVVNMADYIDSRGEKAETREAVV